MEALKTAINAMKLAEKSLAEQGFILRWKFRVKADRGFMRKAVSRLIADVSVQQKMPEAQAVTLKPVRERKARPERKPKAEQTVLEPNPETQTPAEAPETAEARPLSAFDVTEAAEYLGISIAGVYDLIRRGRLPAHGKRGERWLAVGELDQYLATKQNHKTEDA